MDYRRRRSHQRAPGRKPPVTVDEYVRRNLLDAARFVAVPMVRAIKTPSGSGAVAQENRAGAWQSRWRHIPCRTPAAAGSDLLYVWCEGGAKYHVTLLNLFGRYSRYDGIELDVRLVDFPRPFHIWYSVVDRARWGEDWACEGWLRRNGVDDFFHMWHSTTFFSVPSAARRGLYPGPPSNWPSLKAPEYLCVPTPSPLAYVAVHWLPRGRAESAETKHTPGLVRATVLSEWAFLCFLRAVREVMPFFTKFPDSRLLTRRDEPIGERLILFRLSVGLFDLIRSVGVAEILEGTAFDAMDAE